jgi:tetratricopeptide (TPR) repeat protein
MLKDIYSKKGRRAMIPEETNRSLAVEWVGRENELYDGGYYEGAIELFDKAIESDPGVDKAWQDQGDRGHSISAGDVIRFI